MYNLNWHCSFNLCKLVDARRRSTRVDALSDNILLQKCRSINIQRQLFSVVLLLLIGSEQLPKMYKHSSATITGVDPPKDQQSSFPFLSFPCSPFPCSPFPFPFSVSPSTFTSHRFPFDFPSSLSSSLPVIQLESLAKRCVVGWGSPRRNWI